MLRHEHISAAISQQLSHRTRAVRVVWQGAVSVFGKVRVTMDSKCIEALQKMKLSHLIDKSAAHAALIFGPQNDVDKLFKSIVRNKCNNCSRSIVSTGSTHDK
ncbi:Protein of unknown function [Gryllus bimaculatus]|nr:Protein of unknown function [Gryllus bimaculatus]